MPTTQLSDVIVPQEFTAYQIQNSMVSTAFCQSGVLVPNAEISRQLQTDSQSFTVPFWNDLSSRSGLKIAASGGHEAYFCTRCDTPFAVSNRSKTVCTRTSSSLRALS